MLNSQRGRSQSPGQRGRSSRSQSPSNPLNLARNPFGTFWRSGAKLPDDRVDLIHDPLDIKDPYPEGWDRSRLESTRRSRSPSKVKYAPDGTMVEEIKWAPDGTKLADGGFPVDVDEDGHIKPHIDGGRGEVAEKKARVIVPEDEQEGGRWYRAENNRVEQEMLALRNLRELQRAVSERHQAGLCPEAMWTNDPQVFPLPPGLLSYTADGRQLPAWEGGVLPFPPNHAQFFCPDGPQKVGTTKLLVVIEAARPYALHDQHQVLARCAVSGEFDEDNFTSRTLDDTRGVRDSDYLEWNDFGEFFDYQVPNPLEFMIIDKLKKPALRFKGYLPAVNFMETGHFRGEVRLLSPDLADRMPLPPGAPIPHGWHGHIPPPAQGPWYHLDYDVREEDPRPNAGQREYGPNETGDPYNTGSRSASPRPRQESDSYNTGSPYRSNSATRGPHNARRRREHDDGPEWNPYGDGVPETHIRAPQPTPEELDARKQTLELRHLGYGPPQVGVKTKYVYPPPPVSYEQRYGPVPPGKEAFIRVSVHATTIPKPKGRKLFNCGGCRTCGGDVQDEGCCRCHNCGGTCQCCRGCCEVCRRGCTFCRRGCSSFCDTCRGGFGLKKFLDEAEAEDRKLRHQARNRMQDEVEWSRLSHYSVEHPVVFDTTSPMSACNAGRVMQGELNNGYFVEALNAISCRPKLARMLFYCWDVEKGIYILRFHINGTWVRVEIDDYVPPRTSQIEESGDEESKPLCCYSDNFPYVLWPSLVEKAYAKVHTVRPPFGYKGGWEVIGGLDGGRVEEAMSDLTGGVAGRFCVQDVTPDRLFVYFYWLQRHCLWTCRARRNTSSSRTLKLDQYASYVVNRAAHFEGNGYVQVVSTGSKFNNTTKHLESYSVPRDLITAYPERGDQAYTWVHIADFYQYFDTIFECRLMNSPDVGLPAMPESVLSTNILRGPPMAPPGQPRPPPRKSGQGQGPPIGFEQVWACRGAVSFHKKPEFDVVVPGVACPCEVACQFSQADKRIDQVGDYPPLPAPIVLKVYQHVDGNSYRADLVCRSNWLPIRDSMVVFVAKQGGKFKIMAEFGPEYSQIRHVVFRVYATQPGLTVSARSATVRHNLTNEGEPDEVAVKGTFVGCANPMRRFREDEPEPFSRLADGLQRPQEEGACAVM